MSGETPKGEYIMFRKKLVVASIAAAMTVATGMTAYAGAGTIADAKVVKTADSVGIPG